MKYLTTLAFLLGLFVSGCGFALPKTTAQIVSATDSETIALTTTKEGETHVYCSAVWISSHEILTANHCVEYAAEVADRLDTVGAPVQYSTKDEANQIGNEPTGSHLGKVVKVDPEHDLALIIALDPVPDHKYARIASGTPRVGEHLYFVGHPAGLTWTHVEGVVAAYRIDLPVDFYGPFLQVSAPIWFGNSGGAAFNDSGEIVGIASFLLGRVPSCAFYIPTVSIHKFLTGK